MGEPRQMFEDTTKFSNFQIFGRTFFVIFYRYSCWLCFAVPSANISLLFTLFTCAQLFLYLHLYVGVYMKICCSAVPFYTLHTLMVLAYSL